MPLPTRYLARDHFAAAIARDDRGENSIMQVISIAVSAILIVAGLVAAPGLIESARDTNIKTDLANIAYVQEFAHANTGSYIEIPVSGGVSDLSALQAIISGNDDANLKVTLSPGVTLVSGISAAGDRYAMAAISQSGYLWVRTSDSTRAYKGGVALGRGNSSPITGGSIPSGLPSGVSIGGTRVAPTVSVGAPGGAAAENTVMDPSVANPSLWGFPDGVSFDPEGINYGSVRIDGLVGDIRRVNVPLNQGGGNTLELKAGEQWRLAACYKTSADWDGTSNNSKLRLQYPDGTISAASAGKSVTWKCIESSPISIPSGKAGISSFTIVSNHTVGNIWWDEIRLERVQ